MTQEFWVSDLGTLTGTADDAFAKTFRQIPDNTMALAKIEAITNEEFKGNKHLKIDWLITDGEFKGQHVFQKLHVFDADSKKRHRSLNMLMLLYKMFELSPKSKDAPTNQDLAVFNGRVAGIKIQETEPNDEGKTYNWVSEIWPAKDFKCETGHTVVTVGRPDSALSRHAHMKAGIESDSDLPF